MSVFLRKHAISTKELDCVFVDKHKYKQLLLLLLFLLLFLAENGE